MSGSSLHEAVWAGQCGGVVIVSCAVEEISSLIGCAGATLGASLGLDLDALMSSIIQ